MGQSVVRREGREKVTGQAKYVDDLSFPGMIFGATVRSSVPRGRIRTISFEGTIPWNEFVIVTAKDVPGKNIVALIEHDQPYLADGMVNHPEEAIVLLAHPDKYLLEEARRHVRIEIDPLPAIFTIEDSLAQKEIVWGKDNVQKSFLIETGNMKDAWTNGHVVVEGAYETGAQEQLYIEPQGMIAVANPADGVTVRGSLQCPFYIHKALIELFALPPEKIRVIQTETGGGFGGKEEYPTIIAGHAALLAWKSGRPVKIIYDRAEDMVATTKRHPSRTKIKTAVDKQGKLTAMNIDFVIDGGAYVTLSPVVLSRGTLHSFGPYACPNVKITSKAVATNTPPHGAFRGFGAPQSLFAIERHMDRVARKVGLSPDEFRRRNFLSDGKTMPTGQIVRDGVDLSALLDRALELSHFHDKRRRFARENTTSAIKKGMGLATFMHGAGFTGSGEAYLASIVAIEATKEGIVRVLTSSTEIGQGKNTVFAQIVAETLRIPIDRIEVTMPDTAIVPNSGPTVASRTAMVVGGLVAEAAKNLKELLKKKDIHFPVKVTAQYQQPKDISFDDKTYRGDAYGTYAWAVYVAEVSVDTVTYEAHVDDFVAVQEIGKVLNPTLASGQIEGGVAQAIGMVLYEKVEWKEGRMVNGQMTNYIMPTSVDVPPIRVFFEGVPYRHSPTGAKGIGELPMDGPAPAILNAIEDAIGVSINKIPCLPEDILEAMERSRA
ncbi:MAG: xanthine dehydrogenase family protein [Deltaproteobacteria bacterium]|nr:xanthine dehydrogenase family protein [Deltaproteobacteria bacterium]